MSFDAETKDAQSKLDKALTALQHDFNHIRTGRANPAMIEHVRVDAYGAPTPIAQCASVTVPEPTQLAIKPWDKSLLKAIEKALAEAQLGMNPQNDGVVVRLQVPPLSTERRKQLAGQAKEACEKAKVAMRNVRRDALKHIEGKGKEQKISEDLVKKTCEKVNELLKQAEAKAEAALKEKTEDILKF